MLEHGGQLLKAAQYYGIPPEDWLDLSTGINPLPYTPPVIPLEVWQRLPQAQDGLLQAAARFYGSENLLPMAGSQTAIQLLPRLRKHARVGVLNPAYAEHAHAWRSNGHEVIDLSPADIEKLPDQLDVLILVQPNNPTGHLFSLEQMQKWHEELRTRLGWLIIDEAFIEAAGQPSMVQREMPEGLIILRSLGKFFGLAGARVGFVFAQSAFLHIMQEALGPWNISAPSRFVATAALKDQHWQETTHIRLKQDGLRLAKMLQQANLPPAGGCSLFQWICHEQAALIHAKLAQRGILTRLLNHPHSLRLGLPGLEPEWQRLEIALTEIAHEK